MWSPGQQSDAAEGQKVTGVQVRGCGADEVVSGDSGVGDQALQGHFISGCEYLVFRLKKEKK